MLPPFFSFQLCRIYFEVVFPIIFIFLRVSLVENHKIMINMKSTWLLVVFPWFSHGFPMFFPCFPMVFHHHFSQFFTSRSSPFFTPACAVSGWWMSATPPDVRLFRFIQSQELEIFHHKYGNMVENNTINSIYFRRIQDDSHMGLSENVGLIFPMK